MRCVICDSTVDGYCTLVPFSKARKFSVVEDRPWLEVCSDCSTFANNPGAYLNRMELEELGELPMLEGGFDTL